MDLFQEPPAQRHSRTSMEAARQSRLHVNAQQARVLNFIRCRGELGATDDEIQLYTGLNPSSERPRRIELLDKGLIWDSGSTRPTRSGRAATVWRA